MSSIRVTHIWANARRPRALKLGYHCRLPIETQWGKLRGAALASRPLTSSTICKENKRSVSKVVFLNELPQGLLDGELSRLNEESSVKKYPTVIQDARNNMQKFENCVLLTRVGNFYELYFEHAEEYGPLLGLKVATKRTNAGPVKMAGFPFFQLERFLKVLVQDLNRHVAISQEISNDPSRQVKSGGLLFDRKVTRVITPGTLIDENFLNPYDHNYLLAIEFLGASDLQRVQESAARETPKNYSDKPQKIGLAWLDLSSGDFFTQSSDLSLLSSDIARIGPKEILLQHSMQDEHNEAIEEILKEDRMLVSYFDPPAPPISVSDWGEMVEEHASLEDARSFTDEEVSAANILLQYVRKQVIGLKLRLQAPKRQHLAHIMGIDKNSLRGLEIHQTMRHNAFKGSLIQAARRTITESGARLLAQRLTTPSTSLTEIQSRLDLVEHFSGHESLLDNVRELLAQAHDVLRLLQKFSFGKGDANDLLELAETIKVTRVIGNLLDRSCENASSSLSKLVKRFEWQVPDRIAVRIIDAIDEEALRATQRSEDEADVEKVTMMARSVLDQEGVNEPEDRLSKRLKSFKSPNKIQDSEEERSSTEDIWIMKRAASPLLERLHEDLEMLQKEKLLLTSQLRERIGATSLSLKWTPGLGHICHVQGKDMKLNLASIEQARVVSSSKSTKSFYLPEWTNLGGRIETAKSRIRGDSRMRIKGEEQAIFGALRDSVIESLVVLRRNAMILDEIDVACSFARLANEFGLKRPIVNQTLDHKIIGGRHLTVELGLVESGRHFTPNQCMLNEKERIWLITGPNMAGKSTFLRQNALISILAQTGSFVPAEYAELGIVDQIFSRVGSADNLSQDQSTFMVEMLETAYILRHATSRSFVIMDEVGRGTTPEDGTAVGFAVLHHLHYVTRCRTLFATHFHALADMSREFDKLERYCTNVIEELNGAFRYDHRMKRGINREPHALKVAKLAGMPDETIAIANRVLMELKNDESENQDRVRSHEDVKMKAQAS